MSIRFIALLILWICFTFTCVKAQVLQVEHLVNYQTPDTCFNKGVSAAYCGIINQKLIVAGGCNFPHEPAATGGEKVYYNYIWATPLSGKPGSQWELLGNLPFPSAYGVTLQDQNSLICVGGLTTQNVGISQVYRISVQGSEISCEELPSLPAPLDNAAGAVANHKIYIVGGNKAGTPSSNLYLLDLESPENGWSSYSIPGEPRVQPVCAISGNSLYLWGGYTPAYKEKKASMPNNGWKCDLSTWQWTEVPAPKDENGSVIALAGGAAKVQPNGAILCIGGVNQEIFLKALNGIYSGPTYMEHNKEWYKFNRKILCFDPPKNRWEILGELEEGARAGAGLVNDGTWNYIINGELKPGIRTSQISRINF